MFTATGVSWNAKSPAIFKTGAPNPNMFKNFEPPNYGDIVRTVRTKMRTANITHFAKPVSFIYSGK